MHPRTLISLLAIGWFAAHAAPAVAAWRPPTSGAVTRPFVVGHNPFAQGNHRGADFAAAPGEPVRAVCTGRVVVAWRIGSSRGVLTLACGPYRVSHLPLATIGPRVGTHVRAGDPIGTADRTTAHDGIHVGVRRATERHGYVDPLRFIRRSPPSSIPVMGPASTPRRKAPAPNGIPAPRPAVPRSTAAPRTIAPPLEAAPRVTAAPDRPLAPWPAWAALAALLVAATTRGLGRATGRSIRPRRIAARTRRRTHAPTPATPGRDDVGP